MKVVGVSGSARKGGNTAILIERVFEPLREAGIECELIELAGKENAEGVLLPAGRLIVEAQVPADDPRGRGSGAKDLCDRQSDSSPCSE